MSHSSNDSEDDLLSKDQSDSQSIDEGSCGGSFGVGGVILKKGPWTSQEDAILVEYVNKHGEGNWNAVQKHSGLSRCGKSCRLRWANHLRPNLKKGAFTADEERMIVELHAKMGNKWARMAAHLPGRTDNEIKNYWNTRIKRRQRAGLPLYPPEVRMQTLNGNYQYQKSDEFNNVDMQQHGLLHANSYEIPDVTFDGLKGNQGFLSYEHALPDMSVGMLPQGLGSSLSYNFYPTTMHRLKRLRDPENLFPGFNSSLASSVVSPFDPFQSESCEKIHQPPFGLTFPYVPNRNKIKKSSPFGARSGSHAFSNGNFSTSKLINGPVKLELPSFQYPDTDVGGCWGTSPVLPSLESVDTFTQSSPLSNGQVQSDCLSSRNSGLLDALLQEAQTLKNQSSEKSSSSSVVTPSDLMDGSNLDLCETGWEDYRDPISPLGRSAASVFGGCTPISGSSTDDPALSESLPGSNIKQEPVEHITNPYGGEEGTSPKLDFSRPDALLGAGWFDHRSCANDNSKADTIAALLGEDLCNDYKHMNETNTITQEWETVSKEWDNMPDGCHVIQTSLR